MTVVFDANLGDGPGTHVFAIGVGRYPHLYGGDGPLANKPLGLEQLESPPVSLKAFLDWVMGPAFNPGNAGFVNASTPLATIEALASAKQVVSINTPTGSTQLDPATRQNIQKCFEAWVRRIKSNPENVGVFYFCGHGLMVADHYLLAEDFGQDEFQPWAHAFDISTTIRALERVVPGAVYYFIDACREISRDMAMTLGANPGPLLAVDLNKGVVRRSVTAVFATGEGALAYAPNGGAVSRFTSALICALSGYCGIKAPGATTWDVDGETVAAAIRKLLEYETLYGAGRGIPTQVTDQWIQGSSVPLLRITAPPKVKVWLDLSPSQRRASYELYLLPARGERVVQSREDRVFKIEVPRGFYEVGALDPDFLHPAIKLEQEELVPPMYPLTLKSQP